MDNNQLLQQLRDLSLEDGRALIVEQAPTLGDHAAFGILLADEALNQLYINPAISLKLAEILTFFGDYVYHLSSHALGLKAKGDTLRVLGLHQNAIDCLDIAGAEFLQLGDEGNWARSRITWILAAAWLGRVDEALQEAKRARETFIRLGELYWACMIDTNTALIYEHSGRYQDAYLLYQQLLEIYHIFPDQNDKSIQRALAIAQCNQANTLAMIGNFENAYYLQQQARTSFIALNETSCVINTDMNLADLDYTQGYYGSALRRYYDTLDMMALNEIDEPPLLALFKLWMARCLMKLNRLQEARCLAEEAVTIQRQLDMSPQRSDALREYATILIALGRLQEALISLEEARTLFSSGKLHYYVAITELQQAEVLLAMGNANEAYEGAYRLKTYFDTQKLVARSVQAALIMVNALMAIEHPEEKVITLSKQATSQARQYNLQEEVYKGYHLLGRLFVLQGNFTRAIRYYKAAIAQTERMLDSLGFELSPTFLQTTWTLYEEMIALCLRQSQFVHAFSYLERARSTALRQHLRSIKASQEREAKNVIQHANTASVSDTSNHSVTVLRLQQELNQWQERYHQYSGLLADTQTLEAFSLDRITIEQELTRCETSLSDLFERIHLYQATAGLSIKRKQKATYSYHIDSTKLRQKLGPTQCLLAYFLYEGKLVFFLLTTESLLIQEVPGAALQLERLLPLLYAHLQPAGWSDIHHPPQKAFQHLLYKLYGILIAPIIDMLPSHITSLIVVPYGPLHDLPFHALYDGQQFLIERFEISYLPASSLFASTNNTQEASASDSMPSSASTLKSSLILGYAGNGDAQSILDEATVLANLLHGKCYVQQEATIKSLLANASNSPIIHIATHGRMRLDAPHFSSMLLADGQFTAIDAFQLDVKGCELITLSGCETGKALIGGGDEQIGLGQAFLAAGARSLLISLWPVEDIATTLFMQHFYQGLLNGKTKVEAVRSAQCHVLHHQSARYAHPYFWAAFRLVGETGTLSITQKPISVALDTQVTQKTALSH